MDDQNLALLPQMHQMAAMQQAGMMREQERLNQLQLLREQEELLRRQAEESEEW